MDPGPMAVMRKGFIIAAISRAGRPPRAGRTLTVPGAAVRFRVFAVRSRGVALIRVGKTKRSEVDQSRRNFLLRCCQGASAALVPPGLRSFAFPAGFPDPSMAAKSAAGVFHLRPHYRAKLPLESMLFKVQAGSDQFVSEKYAHR